MTFQIPITQILTKYIIDLLSENIVHFYKAKTRMLVLLIATSRFFSFL